MRPSSLVSVVLVAGLGGRCSDREVGKTDLTADHVVTKVFPVTLNRALDLLFVVDDSGSMAGEQASLAANFPALMGVLQTLDGGLPDVHIGIVSTNVGAAGMAGVPGCAGRGDDGDLLVRAGCPALAGRFISDVADARGDRIRNYAGDLDTQFACMAQLGTDGCGFEMPLEAVYRALQPGKNPGFLRPDAYLAVVFITDEDDCSTELGAMFGDPAAGLASPLGPRTSYRCFEFGVTCDDGPAEPRAFGTRTGCKANPQSPYLHELDRYVDFLKSLKADPSLIMVSGIIGVDDDRHTVVVGPDPANPTHPAVEKSCFLVDPADPTDGAAPPVRLAEFLHRFPNRNSQTSICSPTLQDSLAQVGELIKMTLGVPCFGQPLRDLDPARPGPQYECSVVEVREPRNQPREETVIPACDSPGAAMPCWRIEAAPLQCAATPGQLTITVERGGHSPPSFTFLHVQCVGE